jgi:hypothetical protein
MSRRPQSGYGQLSPRRFASAATVCAVLLFLLFAGSIDAVPYLSGALSGALGVNGFETQLALALVLAAVAVPGQRRIRSWLGRFVSRALPLETEEVQALSTESEPAPVQRTERGTPAGSVRDNVFRKEGDYWTIVFGGAVVRLKDAKGLGYIAHLLRHPGEEFHATELMRLLGDAPATAHGRREAQVVGHDPATGSGQPLRVSDLGNAGARSTTSARSRKRPKPSTIPTGPPARGRRSPSSAVRWPPRLGWAAETASPPRLPSAPGWR